MRTQEEVLKARDIVIKWYNHDEITEADKWLLAGISVALSWSCGGKEAEESGSSLERLISGEPIRVNNKELELE